MRMPSLRSPPALGGKIASAVLSSALALLALLTCYEVSQGKKNAGTRDESHKEKETFEKREERQFKDRGCYHIYLDVGSNVGTQVRKLYEPELFSRPSTPPSAAAPPPLPNTHTLERHFDRLFGNATERRMDEICTFGFEPNPAHRPALERLQRRYRKGCGWNVTFHTETAVSNRGGGQADFFAVDVMGDAMEVGASIVESNTNVKGKKARVSLVRLSTFILNLVASQRRRTSDGTGGTTAATEPKRKKPPAVLLKLDIEGSELEVMLDLLLTGALSQVDVALVEWHMFMSSKERAAAMNSLRDNLAAIQHLNRQFGGRGSKLEVIRAGAADEVKVSAGKAEAPPQCDKK